jgi:hypothetical protein
MFSSFRANIYDSCAGCFGNEIITAEKMYDLHFTDAQRFYGDPNEHQPEVL